MKWIINMSRRDFIKMGMAISGGLLLGFRLNTIEAETKIGAGKSDDFVPNAFIHIGKDGTVTIIVNKSEMGQGVYTSLPMIVAEELEADWRKIRVEAAPVDPAYNHTQWGPVQGTGGSTSVRSEWDRLSRAGAAARMMLVSAAAKLWKVDPSACKAENGHVIHTATKRKLSYGELATEAAKIKPPDAVTLKKDKDWKLIGKPMKRLDTLEKCTGAGIFGMDVKRPDLLTAVIARPPVFGAKIKSVNDRKARSIPGVREVVQVEEGVAVVADGFWPARLGRDALEIEWNLGPLAGFSTERQRSNYAELARKPGAVARKAGDPDNTMKTAAKTIVAEYEVPYLAHATMEPLNCVVDPVAGEIWTGTQSQTMDRNRAAAILGKKNEDVQLHTMLLGGGFGRRANPKSDFVSEAAHVAKAVGKPVKVIRTREDDIKGGWFRPFWYDRIEAGLDAKGNLAAWRHVIVGQSILKGTAFEQALSKDGIDGTSVEGAKDLPYAIPNVLVTLHSPDIDIPVQWWRSVGHSHTAFVVESFIDEVAHAAGKDPFEFRRVLLAANPRHKGVLELAAKKAGWGKRMAKGKGRGIAVHNSFGSFVAQVADVTVSPTGEVHIDRVVCAVDCGKYVNPDTIEAQMESGVVFGLSAALHGAITFKDGRVEQSNFSDYPILRIKEMPKMETYIVKSREAPGGIGEPGVPPIAPAVANAIFAATGKRIRHLPIKPGDLKA